MGREVERFTAKEPNGICHTVSCWQEYSRKSYGDGPALLPGTRLFRTSTGVLLKEIDEFTFHVLGSGKMLYKQDFQQRVGGN